MRAHAEDHYREAPGDRIPGAVGLREEQRRRDTARLHPCSTLSPPGAQILKAGTLLNYSSLSNSYRNTNVRCTIRAGQSSANSLMATTRKKWAISDGYGAGEGI